MSDVGSEFLHLWHYRTELGLCYTCECEWPCRVMADSEQIAHLTADVERLTRELDAERHHRINLDVIAKNLTVKCDQQTRALETSRRSVDDWREAWEQKQIELERAEAERDALAAQVAALREALGLAIAGLTNLSALRILTGQYCTEANELVERLCAALAAAREDEQDGRDASE